jgi:hypothetical protein
MRVLQLKYGRPFILLFGVVLSVALFAVLRSSASAATISVVTGADALNDNGQCQFSEAIQNINDQAQTNDDCAAGNGSEDTIQLPSGTVTLTAESSLISEDFLGTYDATAIVVTKSIKLVGQGSDNSRINASSEVGLALEGSNINVTYQDFTLLRPGVNFGLRTVNATSTTIEGLVIDGQGQCSVQPLVAGDSLDTDTSVTFKDISIKNLECTDAESPIVLSIVVNNVNGGTLALDASDISVTDISALTSAIGFAYGINVSGDSDAVVGYGDMNATISNLSVSKIASQNIAVGSGPIITGLSDSDSRVTASISNATFVDVIGEEADYTPDGAPISIPGRAIGAQIARFGSGATEIELEYQNVLIAGSTAGGQPGSCANLLAGEGYSLDVISRGGNITDDSTCTSIFDHESDQSNKTNLSDTLEDMANNGGAVPTIALLPGSPAIDAGVCNDDTPETDARGTSRPQGKTCDSGAYEVEQATPSGTVSGGKAVAVNVPAGVTVTDFSSVTSGVPADTDGDAQYDFPLGLLSFELGVPEGSTNEISLDFESDLEPEEVVARKYNPSDQTFTTLASAQITKITKDDKPTLRLTYAIEDGEFPDLDGVANGVVTDPIGLATEKTGVLANTGLAGAIITPLGIFILGLTIATYIDYRKHKRPLMEADPYNASTYTYWHHLKTVTVPLFAYRISFAFETKRSVNP